MQSLLQYRFNVDIVQPELLFTGFIDYKDKISSYIDCFPMYFNIKANYEELFPVLINLNNDASTFSINIFQGLYIEELKR